MWSQKLVFRLPLRLARKTRLSSATRNCIMIRLMALLYCFDLLVNLATRRRGAAANSTAQSGELTPGGFENETASERRTRDRGKTWQSDVAQGCPTGTDKEERAWRLTEEQGGQTPRPHPARVGRRMWQSLSLITHTHTHADATCKARRTRGCLTHASATHTGADSSTYARRIMFCESALPQDAGQSRAAQEMRRNPTNR